MSEEIERALYDRGLISNDSSESLSSATRTVTARTSKEASAAGNLTGLKVGVNRDLEQVYSEEIAKGLKLSLRASVRDFREYRVTKTFREKHVFISFT